VKRRRRASVMGSSWHPVKSTEVTEPMQIMGLRMGWHRLSMAMDMVLSHREARSALRMLRINASGRRLIFDHLQ
jgi:hypothetical protein